METTKKIEIDAGCFQSWLDEEGVKVFSTDDLEEMYDQMLDDEYSCTIGSIKFDGSRILHELDPIAYRCGFNDWLDAGNYVEIGDEDLFGGEYLEDGEDEEDLKQRFLELSGGAA